MKKLIIGILIVVLSIGGVIGLSYLFGWVNVHQTKTIGKAKQNADREVFEQTQSYIQGKRQAAIKYYKEYQQSTEDQKKLLKNIISHDFSSFDEDKYLTGEIRDFIHSCKYQP